MKILRKAFYVVNDLLEQCKLVINEQGVEVLPTGRVYLKLASSKSSLSLKEFEVIRKLRAESFTINASDLTGIEYRRISADNEVVLKLFGKYCGKNPNIFDVNLKTEYNTHRFLLTQRDMIKLRNYVRKITS
ncbi:MAG: hypothetical protein QXR55_00165 [Sulfolobales archaeon]